MIRARLPARARAPGADALALLAGLSLPLAYAPFGLAPLAVAAAAVLFATWRAAAPGRAAWRGWLFGLGAFGFGVSWIQESFHFSHVGPALSVPLTAGLVALLALYPALAGLGAARLAGGRGAAALLLVYPAAWTLVEWLRGWLLSGFTWLQLGYSQAGGPLAGYAPVTGVYGLSWMVALSGAGLALLPGTGRRACATVLAGLAALWVGGALLRPLAWTVPAGAPLAVALVQGNVPQDLKWLPAQREPTLRRYLRLTRAHWDADLVIWPETALPGFLHEFDPFLAQLAREARATDTDLLLGAALREPGGARYYNAVALLGADRGVYRKHHLVPFGEYLPLPWLLGGVVDLMQIPMSDFSPGPARQPPLTAAGYPVAISVCYEAAFGARIAAPLPAAALLVNVSNDAWFGDTIGPHQNLQMARMRALETGRWMLRATNTGVTAVIAADGRVRARLPQFEAGVLTARALPMRGATPYVRSGDAPVLGLLGIALIGGLLPARRRASGTGAAPRGRG